MDTLKLTVRSGFKPDVYTHLGLQSGNKYRLPSTIYSEKEVMDWQFPTGDEVGGAGAAGTGAIDKYLTSPRKGLAPAAIAGT